MKKIVLSAFAAFAMLAAQAQIPTNGLVVHYPMNGNLNDISGNGYNAVGANISYTTGVQGNANGAASLDGSNSSITYDKTSNNASFDLQNYTVSVWVKLTSMPNIYANLFEIGTATYFRFIKQGPTSVRFQMGNTKPSGGFQGGSVSGDSLQQELSFYQNNWNHLLLTSKDSSGFRVSDTYLNGKKLGTYMSDTAAIRYTPSDNLLQIGHRADASALSLNGALQDFCYYNRIVTEAEIEQIYQANMVSSIQGVEEKDVVVKIFPNPAQTLLVVNCDESIESIEVYNVVGKQVIFQQGEVKQINVSNLSNGMYWLNLKTKNGGKATKKFVKQ